jgi:hypothetical protein
MGFFRILPSKDTWITDAHPEDTVTVRATGSNHGRSPSLYVFARKGDINSSSIELARTMLQFDLTELSGKIYDEGVVPSSSVSYILKMSDMKHEYTVPSSYDLFVYPLSRSWDEGNGIDDNFYRDGGYASWMSASSTEAWTTSGSDFITDQGSGSQRFDHGDEDLEVDITDVVVNWLTGTFANNGLLVKMGDTEESNAVDYFTKKFHGWESKYVDKIPYIEARWDDVLKDNRNNFAFDVENTLVMYNLVRGELTSPAGVASVTITNGDSYSHTFNAGEVSTGILTASVTISSTGSYSSSSFSDIWVGASTPQLTSSFVPAYVSASHVDPYDEFVVDVANLKGVYYAAEEARLIVNVKKRDWVTHVGLLSSGSDDLGREREYIEKMYYSIVNDETGETIVPFGTGSIPFTQLSYNGDGNYFNLCMNGFIPGFKYRLLFLIDINRFDKKIVDDDFTFKVI